MNDIDGTTPAFLRNKYAIAGIGETTYRRGSNETTRNLAVRLNPYRMFQLRAKGRPQANNVDHKLLLALIEAGNADEAYALMRGHVTVQGDVLAEYISCAPGPVLPGEYA